MRENPHSHYLFIHLSICFSSHARVRGYNRRLKECLMSQTSHVGAIISTGTAYKAAIASARRSYVEKGRQQSGIGSSGKRIVIQRRTEALARGPAPRFECKAGPNGRRSSRLRINFVSLNPETLGRGASCVCFSPCNHTCLNSARHARTI